MRDCTKNNSPLRGTPNDTATRPSRCQLHDSAPLRIGITRYGPDHARSPDRVRPRHRPTRRRDRPGPAQPAHRRRRACGRARTERRGKIDLGGRAHPRGLPGHRHGPLGSADLRARPVGRLRAAQPARNRHAHAGARLHGAVHGAGNSAIRLLQQYRRLAASPGDRTDARRGEARAARAGDCALGRRPAEGDVLR